MKKTLIYVGFAVLMAGTFVSCKKASFTDANSTTVSQEEQSMVAAAGFNSNWVERSGTGYLVEGDIYLTKAQLQSMAGVAPSNNFIVGDEEHYHTYNMVTTPSSGTRN